MYVVIPYRRSKMKIRPLIAVGALGMVTLAGSSVTSVSTASAMPIDNLANVASTNVNEVRYVCGRYRCWWTPGREFYGPRFSLRFGPRYHRGYGAYGFYGGRYRW